MYETEKKDKTTILEKGDNYYRCFVENSEGVTQIVTVKSIESLFRKVDTKLGQKL